MTKRKRTWQRKLKISRERRSKLPETPGVYLYWKDDAVVYVGKAINLKRRVQSYFLKNLTQKTKRMMGEATHFSYVLVASEFEALLLEARLIKSLRPKYNVSLKDDKHPLYVKITKDKYPRVITARLQDDLENSLVYCGPFPSTYKLRSVLKMLRKVFPYSTHKVGKRGCIHSQLGYCNPCPSVIENSENPDLKMLLRKQYLRNIRMTRNVLNGRFKKTRADLVRRMNHFSRLECFEEAMLIREQIEKLDYISSDTSLNSGYLTNPNFLEDVRANELATLHTLLSSQGVDIGLLKRIECYDIAHLGGDFPSGSMVTFIEGEPDKSLYRHFKIRQKKGSSDTDSLMEVARRRSKYLVKWGSPDLIIVDGGKGQVSKFKDGFGTGDTPIIGLAKRQETLIIPVVGKDSPFLEIKVPQGPALNLVQRLRDEAHRFSRRYHHKQLQKYFIPQP